MKHENKVVLITGCSSGIGFQTALKFARNGFSTFAAVRNLKSEGSLELQEIALQENLSLDSIEIDVTKDVSVAKGVHTVLKRAGAIDILINNAGFGFLGPLELFSIDEIKQQYDTNVFGMIRMIKEVLPLMRARKSGKIINLSSVNGLISFPLWSVYSSSKFAIETLSESLRFEVAPFGICVAMIEPGSYLTNFSKNVKHPVAMLDEDQPYKKVTHYFFRKYYSIGKKAKASWIGKFANSQKVVDKIYEVSLQKNPRLRNVVGIDAQLFFILKYSLPEGLWNWILRKVYKW